MSYLRTIAKNHDVVIRDSEKEAEMEEYLIPMVRDFSLRLNESTKDIITKFKTDLAHEAMAKYGIDARKLIEDHLFEFLDLEVIIDPQKWG